MKVYINDKFISKGLGSNALHVCGELGFEIICESLLIAIADLPDRVDIIIAQNDISIPLFY